MVGAIAVVVSLRYVAVQLRQNTHAIEASSRAGLLDGDIGLISDYMPIRSTRLFDDKLELSPEDERRFTWIVIKALRIREFAWHQRQLGLLDEPTWQSYLAPAPNMFSSKRAQAVQNFYTGDPAFVHVMRAQAGLPAP